MSSLYQSFILLILVQSIFGAVFVPNLLSLKKHHGAMCDVCKSLVEGGEKIGDEDLDAWLDVNIGTLCWTMLLPIHHECEKELKSIKKELKKDIENKEAPEKACEDVDIC